MLNWARIPLSDNLSLQDFSILFAQFMCVYRILSLSTFSLFQNNNNILASGLPTKIKAENLHIRAWAVKPATGE